MRTLKELMDEEFKALLELFMLLKEQYNIILSGESIDLGVITEKIDKANRLIAQKELERRNFQASNHINFKSEVKENSDINKEYQDIKKLIKDIQLQREANDEILKQRLTFTNKILALINPNRNVATYDARGNFRR